MPPVSTPDIKRWHIGCPPEAGSHEGVIVFTASELSELAPGAGCVLGFHQAMLDPVSRAADVDIHLPAYRPRSLLPVLSWLAGQLGRSDAVVSWYLDRQQGPDTVRKLLASQGWTLERDRAGRTVRLSGRLPAGLKLPQPASFVAALGSRRTRLRADYGVFSPGHVDEGSALLLDVALRYPAVSTVADVGIGYGTLAIGLVLNSAAESAAGTDVDCVALWLARQNADAAGVPLRLGWDADPASMPPTRLTVCNIPTHISAGQTRLLMAGLADRARHGTVLAVVHASLADRYTRYLTASRLRVERHQGAAHVVLAAAR